jgi:predicted RNase H-like HicB family nuclease
VTDRAVYTVRVHDEPDGTWWAEVDELPGLFTSGHERGELLNNLSEAISLYLSEPGRPVHVELAEEPGSVTEQRVRAIVAA